jgi:hypothetical protein
VLTLSAKGGVQEYRALLTDTMSENDLINLITYIHGRIDDFDDFKIGGKNDAMVNVKKNYRLTSGQKLQSVTFVDRRNAEGNFLPPLRK